jgi:O-antigen/teichoic acid export membrane protein
MNFKIEAAKNVGAAWLSLLVHLITGFFLSAFILHKLGDVAFGLWVLIFSLTGYYGLFDFGIRASIVRHVARFAAERDQDRLKRFINTSLAAYSIIALLVLAVTVLVSFYLGSLFRIPSMFLRTGQWLLLLVGGVAALGFPASVFSGVLEGFQKFWWQSLTQVFLTLLRALLIVVTLDTGRGLLYVGVAGVAVNPLSYVVFVVTARRLTSLRLGRQYVDRSTLRSMITYSSAAFLMVVADKLRFQSDTVVIGMFVSSAAITYFAVGLKLAEYPTGIVQGLAQIFTPMSSEFDASGDLSRLRQVFIAGNRACALVIFPICVILVILGKPIIEVWVGAKYLPSYSILVLLVVPKTLYLAQAASTKVLLGMGRHRLLALIFLLEAGLNLGLSVLLLRYLGIVGVALGTAIPLACTSLLFLPRHLCRILDVPLGAYLRQAFLVPLALSGPLGAVLLLLRSVFHPHSYVQLLLQAGPGVAAYGLGFLWFFFVRQGAGTNWFSASAVIRQPALPR